MLSLNDLAKRWSVHRNTIMHWRQDVPEFPTPLLLSKQVLRWRECDIDEYDDYCRRRAELRAAGLDPEAASPPQYSLPAAHDVHQLSREAEAAKHEPEPSGDQTSDIDAIRQRIAKLKAQAVQLCMAAGKPIPEELYQD